MTVIKFTVPGEPVAKGRARAFRTATGVGHFTPQKTRSYEAAVRSIAAEAMGTLEPFNGPVSMMLSAFFQAPKSLKKYDRVAADRDALPVTKRPDADNIGKAVADGMNGIVYRDDAQVYSLTVEKHYSNNPRVDVEVYTED